MGTLKGQSLHGFIWWNDILQVQKERQIHQKKKLKKVAKGVDLEKIT